MGPATMAAITGGIVLIVLALLILLEYRRWRRGDINAVLLIVRITSGIILVALASVLAWATASIYQHHFVSGWAWTSVIVMFALMLILYIVDIMTLRTFYRRKAAYCIRQSMDEDGEDE